MAMAEATNVETIQVGFPPPPGVPNEFQSDDGKTYHVDSAGKVRQKGQGKGSGGNHDHKDLACTPDEFLQAVEDVSEADWPKHSLYIWRCDPVTDTTNGAREPKYITVQNSPVSEQSIKAEHGSGTYKLRLNNAGKFVAVTYMTLEDPAYPPHCVPGDWIAQPRNHKWLPWKASIEKWWNDQVRAMNTPAASGIGPASDGANGAVGDLTKLISKMVEQQTNKPAESSENQQLTKTLVTWALAQTADQRKEDSPDKFAAMLKAVKDILPQPQPAPTGPDPMLKFVMDQLLEMQKSNRELTMKLIEVTSKQAAPQPVQDPIEQAKKMGELMQTVAGFANPAEPKDALTTALQEGIPRVIDATERFFSARAVAGFNRPAQPQAQPPQQPGTYVDSQGNRVAYQPQAVVSPPPATPPTVVNPQPNSEPEMDMMQRTLLVNLARRAQSALDLGMTGDQFGEQMLRLVGEIQFDAFVTGVQKDNLLPLLKSVPEAWAMLQPFEPLLPQFVEEFYEWALAVDDDAEDMPVPASVPKPATKSKKGAKK
jgi:hypothetical protein